MGYPLPLNKFESSSPKDNLYQVWLILACWFWRIRFLKIFSHCVFLLFHNYLPLEKDYPLSLKKFESPSPKEYLCQVWLKLVQWFSYDPNPFLHFCDYLPFEEDMVLLLNKLEFSTSMDNLYQVWLTLPRWFWRKKFLNDPTPFWHFCDYLPFKEDLVL